MTSSLLSGENHLHCPPHTPGSHKWREPKVRDEVSVPTPSPPPVLITYSTWVNWSWAMCMTAVFVKCKLPLYSRHCWGHHCMCVVYEGICNSAARGFQYFFSRHDNACVEGGLSTSKVASFPVLIPQLLSPAVSCDSATFTSHKFVLS